MAGAALLQKPEHMEKLLSSLISAVNKPVSVKMRAGVTKDNKLFLNIAKIAEDVGVSMLTLHPRTVEQGYSGKSDWSLIKELKEKVSIPVIGNGDIRVPEDAKRMFEETGCDYVMIGRAAAGNPFLFKQINDYLATGKYEVVSAESKMEYFAKYMKLVEQFNLPFPTLKSQAMHFTRGIVHGADIRRNISLSKDIDELNEIFK